jgi:hypothetical protein
MGNPAFDGHHAVTDRFPLRKGATCHYGTSWEALHEIALVYEVHVGGVLDLLCNSAGGLITARPSALPEPGSWHWRTAECVEPLRSDV